jgi:hypothetical protein
VLRLFDFSVICYKISNGRHFHIWLASWGGSLPGQLRYCNTVPSHSVWMAVHLTLRRSSLGGLDHEWPFASTAMAFPGGQCTWRSSIPRAEARRRMSPSAALRQVIALACKKPLGFSHMPAAICIKDWPWAHCAVVLFPTWLACNFQNLPSESAHSWTMADASGTDWTRRAIRGTCVISSLSCTAVACPCCGMQQRELRVNVALVLRTPGFFMTETVCTAAPCGNCMHTGC